MHMKRWSGSLHLTLGKAVSILRKYFSLLFCQSVGRATLGYGYPFRI